ncbi:hypothetical protein [Archangium lipolyticum]|uniref:hypothetical protein n=1 Tax=Archangium lipolyticum TaxID=2970465 RepID=UPI002149F863|nr:hypothetical protein [Archangium lipolyticum]
MMKKLKAVAVVAVFALAMACGSPEEAATGDSLGVMTAASDRACFVSCNMAYNSCVAASPGSMGLCSIRQQLCYQDCGIDESMPPSSSVTFYAVGDGNGDDSSDFYRFTYSGGVISGFVKIGETGVVLNDLALDAYTSTFYAMGVNGSLYTLNASTGAATRRGYVGGFVNAIDFCGNVLYGWGGDTLYTLDAASGAVDVVIGSVGFSSSGDLACSLWGNLYGSGKSTSSSDALIKINKFSGQGTRIGNFGYSGVYGFEIDQSDKLFGAYATSHSIVLLSVNPNTGAATPVASYPTSAGMNGMATYNMAY